MFVEVDRRGEVAESGVLEYSGEISECIFDPTSGIGGEFRSVETVSDIAVTELGVVVEARCPPVVQHDEEVGTPDPPIGDGGDREACGPWSMHTAFDLCHLPDVDPGAPLDGCGTLLPIPDHHCDAPVDEDILHRRTLRCLRYVRHYLLTEAFVGR